VAIGTGAKALAAGSTAVGQGATASHANSVAVGAGSATTVGAQSNYNAAYVGNSNSTGEANFGGRTLTGVAPGMAGTDAVNVDQLNAGVNQAASQAIDQAYNYTDLQVGRLRSEVNDLRREAFRGIAQAAAIIPLTPLGTGETTLNMGVASYGGYAAGGIAIAHQVGERVNLNGGVGFSGGGKSLMRIGVGMRF
jgi:trimeric autotransporter adhesin